MAVTLREVAAKARVSPTVVSRVLHNKALAIKVSDATAARVRLVAEELGYRCNVAAINFRTRQTLSIGILHGMGELMPRFEGGSGYFGALMDGFIEGAFAQGYSVTLCPKLLSQTPEDAMSDGRFDGLVLYYTDLSEASASMIRNCTVPLVLVHTASREFGCDVPSVVCDNFQGIGLAVEHLVELGHRRIAFAHDVRYESAEVRDRRNAFLSHMRLRGLPAGQDDVFLVEVEGGDFGRLLSRGHTAVIAHNEYLAGRIVGAASEHGYIVPDDLSVVGFDSTSFCNGLRPALTCISQPLHEMGTRAIELLVASIRNEHEGPIEIRYPCGLDVRGSTKSIDALVNI